MQLGVMGLGRTGANIARRLLRNNHECVVFNRVLEKVEQLALERAIAAFSLDDFVQKLDKPRAIWLMVPAGDPTEDMVMELAQKLEAGDILIDGGNSYYIDDIRRAEALQSKGIEYVDIGTSGGVWGLKRGYCMMIGGAETAVRYLDPILQTLAPGQGDFSRTLGRDEVRSMAEQGYLHCGSNGEGRFVKMVHNGIEYGIMAAPDAVRLLNTIMDIYNTQPSHVQVPLLN